MPTLTTAFFILAAFVTPAFAQSDAVPVPDDVKPFVEKNSIPIALETADLNADGRKDHLLVISEIVPEGEGYEEGDGERSVLILVRQPSGSLKLAARNDLVAMCRNCGGVFGDPFAGVTIRGTRFTINNYGGSNSRWAFSYTFSYSRRDRTWQLTRVEETTFHALDPDRTERTHIYTPPKNFGLITFADFDPASFKGKGKK